LLPKWVIFHPRDAELPIWVVDVSETLATFAMKKFVKRVKNVKRNKIARIMKRIVLVSMMCLVAIASTAQGISGRVIDEQAQIGRASCRERV